MYVCLGGPTKQHDFVTLSGPKCNVKFDIDRKKKHQPPGYWIRRVMTGK